MSKQDLEELWILLGRGPVRAVDIQRVYELSRLAVCSLREQRASLEALRDALAACDK